MLDALRKLSATPRSKKDRSKTHEQLDAPLLAPASWDPSVATEPDYSGSFPKYANQFTGMPYWKAVRPEFAPQSPPMDRFTAPRSKEESGEKRRRVARAPAHTPDEKWPVTPQTPKRHIGAYTPGSANNQGLGGSGGPSGGSRSGQGNGYTAGYGNSNYAPPYQAPGYGYAPPDYYPMSYSQLAPSIDLSPQFAPVVVTKPPVVPSMVSAASVAAPSGLLQVPHAPINLRKPGEIQLTRIVDGRLTPDCALDCDDEGGHYIVRPGERFASRYVISRLLGQGTFGKVVQAWDERTEQQCAVKIIRAVPKYRDASKVELRVLTLLSAADPRAVYGCVRMRECFDFRNHVCIVTDLHDVSVYDFLHDNKFAPFPGHHIRDFARQILVSVAHIHDLGLVHTDLKPENVLLHSASYTSGTFMRPAKSKSVPKSPSKSQRRSASRRELQCTDVTLIDFGSAVFEDEYHPSVVSTRHYRAPEIIFGTGWSYACDLWSIGCLLVELCTGRVLFETRDDLEHLHMIERTLRLQFDVEMLAKASKTTSGSRCVSAWPPALKPLKEAAKVEAVAKMRTVVELVADNAPVEEDPQFWNGFLDLVARLTIPDPEKRITAREALQHPWFAN